jgi:endogenous inhibitor of DNA gyrase (YacG/DUF329 family)
MALQPEEYIMFCRSCGKSMDMRLYRLDRAFCSEACRSRFFRRVRSLKRWQKDKR